MKNNRLKIRILGVVFIVMFATILFSPFFFHHSYVLSQENVLEAPSAAHPFGTDNLGRDLLHRTFNGLRLSLALAFLVQTLSLGFGAAVGSVAGYCGGLADKIYTVAQNLLQSFPNIIASLCLILMLGSGLMSLVIALCAVGWVGYARLMRSRMLEIKELDYISGAIAIGAPPPYILVRHILPGAIRPILPLFTLMIGHTILSIAGLGFLGFGVQPPTPEIGLMINDGITYINTAPWMILAPGGMLTVCALLVNMLGDELREWFDPRKEMNPLYR
jgi:peptide/nickel transport system permease protein